MIALIPWILGGIVLLSLGGAFLSWKADIRAEGEQKAIQAFKDQQLEAEVRAKWAAEKGERDAKALLAKSSKRNRELDQQLAQQDANRRAESDRRAKDDMDYSLWRETRLPDFVASRMRRDAQLTPDESRAADVPPGTPIQPATVLPADPGRPVDQSVFGRLRSLIDRATSSGVETVRPSAK